MAYNYERILNYKTIQTQDASLDEIGNRCFHLIQEFFCKEKNHYPFQYYEDNEDWNLYYIWNGDPNNENSENIADALISLWLEKEEPILCGKQMMIRSLFMKDFVNRKVIATLPFSDSNYWNLIFEGGNTLSLNPELSYVKDTPSFNSLGFFSVSELNNIILNPFYALNKLYTPNSLSTEWHKVFLYLCAISDMNWTLDNSPKYYLSFLNFLEKHICNTEEATSIITKEKYFQAQLIYIENIRQFLKGEDEAIITKDLLQVLHSRYVYLPYLYNMIPIKNFTKTFSKIKMQELINNATNAIDTYQKGILWEDVAEYVINHIKDWKITGKRIKAGYQEIDLSIANISLSDDLWQLRAYILVECKNWKNHVDLLQIRNIASYQI